MNFQFKGRKIYRRTVRLQRAGIFRVVLLCMSLILNPSTVNANGFANMFSSMFGMMGSMANMMTTMMSPMSAMGMSGLPMSGFSGLNPMMGGLPGLGMPMSSFGLPMSGLSSLGMPLNALGLPMNGMQAMPFNNSGMPGTSGYSNGINSSPSQQPSTSPGNFWLNGLWVSESGIYLQIRNKIFQLKTPRGAMTGYVTSNGELLNLHVPKSNRTILYTVKLEGNYMQLTGADGRTHLFRKAG